MTVSSFQPQGAYLRLPYLSTPTSPAADPVSSSPEADSLRTVLILTKGICKVLLLKWGDGHAEVLEVRVHCICLIGWSKAMFLSLYIAQSHLVQFSQERRDYHYLCLSGKEIEA